MEGCARGKRIVSVEGGALWFKTGVSAVIDWSEIYTGYVYLLGIVSYDVSCRVYFR